MPRAHILSETDSPISCDHYPRAGGPRRHGFHAPPQVWDSGGWSVHPTLRRRRFRSRYPAAGVVGPSSGRTSQPSSCWRHPDPRSIFLPRRPCALSMPDASRLFLVGARRRPLTSFNVHQWGVETTSATPHLFFLPPTRDPHRLSLRSVARALARHLSGKRVDKRAACPTHRHQDDKRAASYLGSFAAVQIVSHHHAGRLLLSAMLSFCRAHTLSALRRIRSSSYRAALSSA